MKRNIFIGMIFVAGLFVSGMLVAADETPKKDEFKMPKNPVMVMETNQGTIKMKLFPEVAPLACENMIRLAEKGYYDGLTFHRVIKGFMIQGGDPRGNGTGGESIWGKEFKDEFSDKAKFDRKGILAMANRGSATNGSQFFITVSPREGLNGRHTIFGEVISGYDVVQKIETVRVEGKNNKPLEDQKIIKMYLDKGGDATPAQAKPEVK